jgi:sugar lactone lactonase YvrE
MGNIINSFSCENGSMRGMCVDKYNNVFVSDYNNAVVRLFSPEGAYMRNVLTKADSAELTIDSCGNMWLYSDQGFITIYSYL